MTYCHVCADVSFRSDDQTSYYISLLFHQNLFTKIVISILYYKSIKICVHGIHSNNEQSKFIWWFLNNCTQNLIYTFHR